MSDFRRDQAASRRVGGSGDADAGDIELEETDDGRFEATFETEVRR